jgi:hypothetical protein
LRSLAIAGWSFKIAVTSEFLRRHRATGKAARISCTDVGKTAEPRIGDPEVDEKRFVSLGSGGDWCTTPAMTPRSRPDRAKQCGFAKDRRA